MNNDTSKQQHLQIEALSAQRDALQHKNDLLVDYIRNKVDQLLDVMGTSPINPRELDDQILIDLDPIGIICNSFSHVLKNLRTTNSELSLAHDEIEAIFDTAGAAIMVLSPKREIVAYNRKVEEFFLQGQTQVFGRDCREVVCSGNAAHNGCTFDKVVSGGQVDKHIEWSIHGRSFDVIGRPLKDAAGNVTHVVLSYNDVSERKRSMRALRDALRETRESKKRIDGILSSVGDALIVSDDNGRVVLMNHAAEKLLSGENDLASSREGFAALLYQHLQQATDHQGLWVSDLGCPGEGVERIFQARTSMLPRQAGEQGGGVTFLHEVTRAREVERLKSDFVSTAAHELRTPLSSILGFSELILNEEALPEDDLREYIGIVHQKAEGLALIVNDLLDISRIESGEGLQLELHPCPVREMCEETLLGFSVYSDRYTFACSLPETPVRVRADHFAMAQVLENILSNAVKYSPQGTTITLKVTRDAGEARFSISDQGIGMTHDQLEKVFDKFYRADASNTAIPGTGLGMTIVKHIVEAHGGRVWVESHVKQGTRVSFTLPLAT